MMQIQFFNSFGRAVRRARLIRRVKLSIAGVILALGAVAGVPAFFAALAAWNVATGFRPALGYVLGANALYDAGRAAFCNAHIDLGADDIVVALVEASSYTPNLATHDFLNDIPGGAIIATSDPLASKTTTAGVFDADDVLLAAVPAGQQGDYLILYQDTSNSATSRLIGKIDTGGNFPITPNGGDINIAWASTSSKIFKL